MDVEDENLPRRRTWYVLHVKPRTEKKVDDFAAEVAAQIAGAAK